MDRLPTTCFALLWDPTCGWEIGPCTPKPEDYGAKAIGLAQIPSQWGIPWLSVPLSSCVHAEQNSQWDTIAGSVMRYFEQNFSLKAGLIIRSSGANETMDMRGQFDSRRCVIEINALSLMMRRIALQLFHENEDNTTLMCAVVVQPFINSVASGHLSNEFRHAQRSVDFLYEIEGLKRAFGTATRSFRLQRPVAAPNTSHPLLVRYSNDWQRFDSSITKQLETVAAWLAVQNLRGHIEWLVSAKQLYLVQFDTDPLLARVVPMSRATLRAQKPLTRTPRCKVFRRIDQGYDFSNLRKTRSHALLHAAGAYVPPIYVAENVGISLLGSAGPFWDDLSELLDESIIIRFDVPLNRTEWTNLPTLGPLTSVEDARNKIQEAVRSVSTRNINLAEVTVVVHHFIAARAAAWSEAIPGSPHVRIDAIWGLPDGLQSFAHDSVMCNTDDQTIVSQIRYKDRFFDVEPDGEWVVRRATPSIARDEVCDLDEIQLITDITTKVANSAGKIVRIMWFLDVLQGGGAKAPRAMPWIVVEVEGTLNPIETYFSSKDSEQQVRRQVELHADRAVRSKTTLARFASNPDAMGIGGRRVLLQPDAATVRDRTFFVKFAEVVQKLPNQWKVLYAGSMLAHTPYQLQQLGIAVFPLHELIQPRRRTYSRKLVRDGIPARIKASGAYADVLELNEGEFLLALRQKLVEEALEVVYSDDPDELREELADLITVARALARAGGINDWSDVENSAVEKSAKRGEFEQRLFLRSTGTVRGGSFSNPGGADVRRLKSGRGLRIPLVPPLLSMDRERVYNFLKSGIEITVSFREQDVDVIISPYDSAASSSAEMQLSLFDEF